MAGREILTVSPEALWRYRMVSSVGALLLAGRPLKEAVRTVSAQVYPDGAGASRTTSERTLYRWVTAYKQGGIEALEPKERSHTTASAVLSCDLVAFLKSERDLDRDASVPELIRRARELGLVRCQQRINRSTAWRTLKRMGLATARRKGQKRDSRRFSYAERMQMAITDFVHFRAGARRLRRVACYILDDCTRFGLDVLVSAGTGEKTEVFLMLLYRAVAFYGLMDTLYSDQGPAYISDDTACVMANFHLLHIMGEARYPEGHGKIEKFMQSTRSRILRCLDGNPGVDPDPGALTLRLRHDLLEVYNLTPHESLGADTPRHRWECSKRALRPVLYDEDLRRKFVVRCERLVSNDHVIQYEGSLYEAPRGLAGEKVALHRNLLDGSLHLFHKGRLLRLCPLDPHANATSPRAHYYEPSETKPITKTASAIAFERAYGSVLDPDGGCPDKEDEK